MERRAFVKPNYLVFMKNVRKYLGLVSMSLVCASPLAAMVIQPFVGVTIVQQNVITVKGQVMDEKGEAIIGANVIVEGTAQGMITDMNGNFSFQCPVGAILKVRYIGYLSQTIKVSGNAGTLKVILKEDAETLDEVVVVGYGMVKKSDLTGSVASVNVDEMAKKPQSEFVVSVQSKVLPIPFMSLMVLSVVLLWLILLILLLLKS